MKRLEAIADLAKELEPHQIRLPKTWVSLQADGRWICRAESVNGVYVDAITDTPDESVQKVFDELVAANRMIAARMLRRVARWTASAARTLRLVPGKDSK